MKILTRRLAVAKAPLVAGILLSSLLAAGSAKADLLSVTVSPSAGATPLSSDAPNFTWNGIRTSDFSSINLSALGGGSFSFTELGFLPFASFDPGNFTPAGLNGTAGANPYGLYISFTGAGSIGPTGPILSGSFSSLSYTVWGDPGHNDTFGTFDATHQALCVGCGDDKALGSGTLLAGGQNTVLIADPGSANPLPAAFVDLLFNAADTDFFISPPAPFSMSLDSQFSNTAKVTNSYTTGLPLGVSQVVTIGISAGGGTGGSGTLQAGTIPEPASLTMLGAGVLGLAAVLRRRRKV